MASNYRIQLQRHPYFSVVVADLNGNVLWGYNPGFAGVVANPVKLLSNGHFLVNVSDPNIEGQNSVLQEVDLTGKLIWQMTAADLNNALAAATCSGCNITVTGTHHDFVMLPNGHLVVIAATQKVISGVTLLGDVVIDLDQNHRPVWLWNEFDYLDTSRRPMGGGDWTHTNAILYSADDGNLIISIRHQNWLVKIDYANGSGAGDILWKLGYQGDFTLMGGTDPTDWFYAQHGPSFTTTNTTGQFGLAIFDNGNDRVFPTGVTCGTTGQPACFYSTTPIFNIDETEKTVTLTFNPVAPFLPLLRRKQRGTEKRKRGVLRSDRRARSGRGRLRGHTGRHCPDSLENDKYGTVCLQRPEDSEFVPRSSVVRSEGQNPESGS